MNPSRAMALLLLVLGASCQYRFGSGEGNLSGSFFVDRLENGTEYRLLDSELQARLVDVLKRHKNVILTSREAADTVLDGRVAGVRKVDRERDTAGRVLEVQFVVSLDIRVTGRGGSVRELRVNSNDQRASAGTARLGQPGGSEDAALQDALRELAEAVVRSMSGGW